MALDEYRKKRDFRRTPEPRGKRAPRRGERRFVVQKHAATRLHYDFRLELEGVLKSWAVPKGPSLDPADKRLAMATEDHPIEYLDFEGIIPEGQYGGGTVMVWDRGTWTPEGNPHEGYRAGKLSFTLEGEKLRGSFTLVRTAGRDPRRPDRSWLLMKRADEHAVRGGTPLVDARPESVATGRGLEAIAAERDRVWESERPARSPRAARAAPGAAKRRRAPAPVKIDAASIPGARPAPLPASIRPQLPTLVRSAPEGDRWLHEMKLDGYRLLARIEPERDPRPRSLERGRVRLLSRHGLDWTARFPRVAAALAELPAETALIDGEAVVLLPSGASSFQELQAALGAGDDRRIVYFAFDLLHLDGFDLAPAPLEERKRALDALLAAQSSDALRYNRHLEGRGAELFQHACRLELEGVVSKRRDAPYRPGRGDTWVKVKCTARQEMVIGGYTLPVGAGEGLGALLVGVHEDDELRYVGRVGTGFDERTARQLRRRLEALETKTSPFASRPGAGARAGGITGRAAGRARWVRPELVAEVELTEWTKDGMMRHPTFRGLREDRPARDIVRERPADPEATRAPAVRRRPAGPAKAARVAKATAIPRKKRGVTTEVAGVELSNADRVLYPELGFTKRDLACFYASIERFVLPHLRDRPTTLVRCPEGLGGPCFYQKHTGWWAPAVLRRVHIQEQRKVGEYLVVDSLPALVGLVQLGILEIHTWSSEVAHLEEPDRLVFDLDPGPGVGWARVCEAARAIRDRLAGAGLGAFVKTTGGKGLHVVAPLVPRADWAACAAYARRFAEAIAADAPRAFTTNMSKAARPGKIFLDHLRNVRGATSVAAYSTRARPGAPVSTPLRWDELGPDVGPDHYTVKNLPARLGHLRGDPWAGYERARRPLPSRQARP